MWHEQDGWTGGGEMTVLDPHERSKRGRTLQTELTGRQQATEPCSLVQESWRDIVYADIWSRPGLDRRARFLISMASAAICGGSSEVLDNYVRGALVTNELSLVELREAALHVAAYGGWSRGDALDASITRVQEELELGPAPVDAICGEPWDPEERLKEGFAEFSDVMAFDGPSPGSGVPFLDTGVLTIAFGELWCRRGLDQRSRRFLTLVGVAESAADVPIRSHFHAAMASGNCTAAELHEFVLQYAVHAGWPKASVILTVVLEMASKVDKGLAWDG